MISQCRRLQRCQCPKGKQSKGAWPMHTPLFVQYQLAHLRGPKARSRLGEMLVAKLFVELHLDDLAVYPGLTIAQYFRFEWNL